MPSFTHADGQPRTWLLISILFALSTLLYQSFLWNPLVFDDSLFFNGMTPQIYGHSTFDFSLRWFPYASMGWSAIWLGMDIIWFRLGNLSIHIACVISLFMFLRSLFDNVIPNNHSCENRLSNTWLAFFAALIFALHPVAVYAVGYLIQRSILMATLFGLLFLHAWLAGLTRKQNRWFLLAIACYFVAVFSKEHVILILVVALAMSMLLPPSMVSWRRIALPFIACSIIAAFIVMQMKGVLGKPYEPYASRMLQQLAENQKTGDIVHAHLLSAMTQCTLFFKYLLLWILPNTAWMSIDMREAFASNVMNWPYLLGSLGFVIYAVIAIWLVLQRGRKGLAGFAMLFPWLLFLTELSTVRIQEPFVLYRSYLWMTGALAILPAALSKIRLRSGIAILTLTSLTMFPLAWERLTTFSHPLYLWDDATRLIEGQKNPIGSERIYHNRGLALYSVNLKLDAIADYTHALAAKPDYGQVYNDRGAIYYDLGRYQEASRDFAMAIKLLPNYAKPYLGQAMVLEAQQQGEAAHKFFAHACMLGLQKACEK